VHAASSTRLDVVIVIGVEGRAADAQGVSRIRDEGNVSTSAVGVIIGAAFGGIVTSLVGDIIMPIIGAITRVGFLQHFTGLSKRSPRQSGRREKQGAVLAGQFPHADANFIIIAFVLFVVFVL